MTQTPYERLIALVEEAGAPYRTIEHEPVGRTDLASIVRGNPLEQAAKAMVLVAKRGQTSRYVLAIVGGDRRIDFDAVKAYAQCSYVGLAPADKAAELTGCEMGAVPPFSFDPELTVLVDSAFVKQPQIVFNAARLDRSMVLDSTTYVELAKPTVRTIAKRA